MLCQSFGWYETPGQLFIAMEYLETGDLFAYLHRNPRLSEAEPKDLAYQILEGLSMMHANGFAHRDLNPNVGFASIKKRRFTKAKYLEYSYQITPSG